MVAVAHGVAGYIAGCRCTLCTEAQRAREHALAVAEAKRWEDYWAQKARAEAIQKQADDAARSSSRRKRRKPGGQSLVAYVRPNSNNTAPPRTQAWSLLLATQRREIAQIHGRAASLRRWASSAGHCELLWRQAEERRSMAERHLTELGTLWDSTASP